MSGSRVSYNFRFGYVKITDLGSQKKRYYAILWRGSNMVASKRNFSTATEATEYGHEARKKSRLLKGLFGDDDDISE